MFVHYIGEKLLHFGVYSTSGDIISTSENVHYIGAYHDACGRYSEYIGGYHEYYGEI